MLTTDTHSQMASISEASSECIFARHALGMHGTQKPPKAAGMSPRARRQPPQRPAARSRRNPAPPSSSLSTSKSTVSGLPGSVGRAHRARGACQRVSHRVPAWWASPPHTSRGARPSWHEASQCANCAAARVRACILGGLLWACGGLGKGARWLRPPDKVEPRLWRAWGRPTTASRERTVSHCAPVSSR